MDAYLSLTDVAKSYDGRQMAVADVTFEARKGEFITFLGPSGSGKTTTLMMISGFEDPTAGTIKLDGRDITKTKPDKRNIGMVFQNYALFPHMTVRKNIAFPLRMRHMDAAEANRRVEEFLDLVHLSEHADKHPRELSGGQQQRVALARGLVFRPELLLLDEPLGALDKNLRERMQIEIKRIQEETGVTMIYVTHDQSEAMSMSDRVVVFNKAKIEQIGRPAEIYDRPATKFVGEFVGDSNFFPGEADAARRGVLDVAGIGQVAYDPAAGAHAGKVDVLLRPERVAIGRHYNENHPNRFEFDTHRIINYGDYCLLIGAIGRQPMRVRTSPRNAAPFREGEKQKISWAFDDMHIIDAA